MAFAKSQSYRVDNRYSQARDVADNDSALSFLNEYIQTRKNNSKLPITSERAEDDRFIFPALTGTVPVGALPFEPRGSSSVGNTDGSASFRNTFRAR